MLTGTNDSQDASDTVGADVASLGSYATTTRSLFDLLNGLYGTG